MERRLVDAKEAYELACEGGYYVDFVCRLADLTSLKDLLDDCTAIDAVEVVRCAQCVSYRRAPVKHCALIGMQKEDDDYCSCGERREPDGK
jgi:hypothetical protein